MYLQAVSLLSCLSAVQAHSWVEQMLVVQNGKFTGNPGYMRGYTPRGPGFSDPLNVNLLPALSTGRTRIDNTDPMCKSDQTTAKQTAGFPKLNASPGDKVALRYLENGHVTLPQNQKGKPGSGGTVLVYATSQPKQDEKLTDVIQWNTNGTGGDGRGKLLTVQNFDDGRCYQVNSSPMSTQRQQQFPNKPAGQPSAPSEELWCETDVTLPSDAQTDTDLTLYWAWQWNTLPNMDPGIPDGKDEWYTSCMDVNMLAAGQISKAASSPPTKLLVQDPQQSANPNFAERTQNTTLPDGGPEGGDGNLGNAASSGSPGAASGAAPSTPAAAPSTAAPPASSAPPSATATFSGGMTTIVPIPFPTNGVPQASGASGFLGSVGGPHTMTLTQVVIVTFNGKRSVETKTAMVADIVAGRRRNVFS